MALPDIQQVSVQLQSLQFRKRCPISGLQTKHKQSQYPTDQMRILSEQSNQNAAPFTTLPSSINEEVMSKATGIDKYHIIIEAGQRSYGPPANWIGEPPKHGTEVFIYRIPKDCLENELITLFERCGRIYTFRLKMFNANSNRGFAFCAYANLEESKCAIEELNGFEIRPGVRLGVLKSVDNCRLFVGGILKTKTKEEILKEMRNLTSGVKDVICYPSVRDKTLNRGFVFVEYETHKEAGIARRKLLEDKTQLWDHQIAVDWAEPERQVDEQTMSQVKVLYVRNLMPLTTEQDLRDRFELVPDTEPCSIIRIKKIDDYAFVHFAKREQAEKCLAVMNGTIIDGSEIEVTWSKPPDKSQQQNKQLIRQQQQYQQNQLASIAAAAAAAYSSSLYHTPTTNPNLANLTYSLMAAAGPPATTDQQHLATATNPSSLLVNPSGGGQSSTPVLPAVGGGSQQDLRSGVLLADSSECALGQYHQQQTGLPPPIDLNQLNLVPGDHYLLRNKRPTGLRPTKRPTNSRSSSQRDRKHPVQKTQEHQINPMAYLEFDGQDSNYFPMLNAFTSQRACPNLPQLPYAEIGEKGHLRSCCSTENAIHSTKLLPDQQATNGHSLERLYNIVNNGMKYNTNFVPDANNNAVCHSIVTSSSAGTTSQAAVNHMDKTPSNNYTHSGITPTGQNNSIQPTRTDAYSGTSQITDPSNNEYVRQEWNNWPRPVASSYNGDSFCPLAPWLTGAVYQRMMIPYYHRSLDPTGINMSAPVSRVNQVTSDNNSYVNQYQQSSHHGHQYQSRPAYTPVPHFNYPYAAFNMLPPGHTNSLQTQMFFALASAAAASNGTVDPMALSLLQNLQAQSPDFYNTNGAVFTPPPPPLLPNSASSLLMPISQPATNQLIYTNPIDDRPGGELYQMASAIASNPTVSVDGDQGMNNQLGLIYDSAGQCMSSPGNRTDFLVNGLAHPYFVAPTAKQQCVASTNDCAAKPIDQPLVQDNSKMVGQLLARQQVNGHSVEGANGTGLVSTGNNV